MSSSRIPSRSVPFGGRPVSRRQFLRTAAGTGLVLGSVLALPRRAYAMPALTTFPAPFRSVGS